MSNAACTAPDEHQCVDLQIAATIDASLCALKEVPGHQTTARWIALQTMSVLQQLSQNVLSANLLPVLSVAQQQWRGMAAYSNSDTYNFKFGTNSERGAASCIALSTGCNGAVADSVCCSWCRQEGEGSHIPQTATRPRSK